MISPDTPTCESIWNFGKYRTNTRVTSNLAFWMSKGPVDNALSWAQMSAATRSKLKKRLTSKGT